MAGLTEGDKVGIVIGFTPFGGREVSERGDVVNLKGHIGHIAPLAGVVVALKDALANLGPKGRRNSRQSTTASPHGVVRAGAQDGHVLPIAAGIAVLAALGAKTTIDSEWEKSATRKAAPGRTRMGRTAGAIAPGAAVRTVLALTGAARPIALQSWHEIFATLSTPNHGLIITQSGGEGQ